MIINFPTGFYSTLLSSDNLGNVTFLVSNNAPPRTDLTYPKAPQSVINRTKNARNKNVLQRRNTIGDLVFSVSISHKVDVGNSNKTYEIGQILEFNESGVRSINPMLVADKTEIVHNISKIDYSYLGIDEEDAKTIENTSLIAYEQLNNQLNTIRENRKTYEEIILSNQKIINDADRAINALSIVNDLGPGSGVADLISKIQLRKSEALHKIDESTNLANDLASQAEVVLNQIRAVATVIK